MVLLSINQGATGFVGAHLVQQLLLTTPYQVKCLVRPKTSNLIETSPLDRLTQVLKDFQIWDTLGDKVNKLQVVAGDLATVPHFGISDADYSDLLSAIGN
jgi:thioester reductase-like protein